jgi:hypothetical protein
LPKSWANSQESRSRLSFSGRFFFLCLFKIWSLYLLSYHGLG